MSQNPFSPPPMQPTMMGYMKPHRATMLLIFSILSFVVCFIFGIVSWVMASSDLKEMDAGTMDPSGRETTKAAKIVAMISVCLVAAVIALYLVLVVVGLGFAAAGAASGAGGAGGGSP